MAVAFTFTIGAFSGTAAAEPVRLASSQSVAANSVGLFATGVGADGTLLVEGAADAHYSVVSGPVVGATAVVETDGFPIRPGLWFDNGPGSQWIAPPLTGIHDNAVGTYAYRTEFSLSEGNPTDFELLGRWSTDNSGLDILINGLSTGNTNLAANEFTFLTFRDFRISRGFRPGLNTLDFMVRNAPCGGCQNPSGLRVEFGVAPVPEPGTLLLLMTGAGGIGRRAWKQRAQQNR